MKILRVNIQPLGCIKEAIKRNWMTIKSWVKENSGPEKESEVDTFPENTGTKISPA